jgi:hypothetical protein
VMVKLTCNAVRFNADFMEGKTGINIELPNVMMSGMEPIATMGMPLFTEATRCTHPYNVFTFLWMDGFYLAINGGGTIQPFSLLIFNNLVAYSDFCT